MNILNIKKIQSVFTQKVQKNIVISLVIAVLALYVLVPVNKEMHALWSVPYFSGAVNSTSVKDWKIAVQEIDNYKNLSWEEKLNYDFKKYPATELMDYNGHGYIGFLYVTKVIHFIAPSVPLIKAIKVTQVLLQLLIMGLILWLLPTNSLRIIFLVIYGLNPVIFVFTKMPIYYFWQILPAFLFAILYLKKGKIHPLWIVLFGIILGFSLLIRITIVGFIIATLLLLIHQKKYLSLPLLLIPLIIVYYQFSPPKVSEASNFHTPFIGLGAYPNHLNIDVLSDDEGVNYYKKNKDSTFSFSFKGGYFDQKKKEDYFNYLEVEYLSYVKKYPLEIARNAFINTVQGYSFGHFANNGIIPNSISFIFGSFVIGLLLYFKKYILFITIGLSVGTVSLFYPPIPSYMFGTYLIIVISLLTLCSEFGKK